jgi:hypothetical protein
MKSPGHPRPIEIRLRIDCEPDFLQTITWKIAHTLLRGVVRILKWRADLFIWDSRSGNGACPCWYAKERTSVPNLAQIHYSGDNHLWPMVNLQQSTDSQSVKPVDSSSSILS